MRNSTLKQLRALAAVIENGTVTAAAHLLSVTPPAITSQLQLLENAAGMKLLERTNDGYQPTGAGREVYNAWTQIETSLGECAEVLARMKGLESGQVFAGVISTAKYFAPKALAAFAQAHPGIDVRLTVGNRREIISALETNRVDFAIMGRPPKSLLVDSRVIGDHPHVIIAPPDHPLAGSKNISPARISKQTLLARELGSGTRLLTERLFIDAGIKPVAGMEMGSNETIKQAVIAGLGIALLSAHTIAAEISEKRLVVLDVVGLPVVRQWYIVKRHDKHLLPAAQALMDFIVANTHAYLPSHKDG